MGSLKMTAKLSRKYIPTERVNTLHLLIDLEAAQKEAREGRLPLNLGFVIDRSGSMGGDKIEYTKQAVQYAINHFTPSDIASLTVFDNEVQVLYPAREVEFKDEFKGVVSRVFPGGSTNLSGGLVKGYREVAKNVKPEQVNRVLLLTDGLANVGITDPEKLCAKAAGMKKAGVTVTTLGVGDDFDEDLLTKMAEQSGGNYYFIDSTDHIPQIFAQELQSLLSVAAQDVKVSFRYGDVVRVTKVWNYMPSGDSTIEIGLPDLFSADHKIIIMELEVTAAAAGPVPLGNVSVSYDDAGAKLEFVSFGMDLQVDATRNPELLELPEEPEVMMQVELNKTAEAREEAIRLADEGDFQQASSILRERHQFMASLPCESEDMSAELAAELLKVSESVQMFESRSYDANSRKKMSYQNYQRRNTKKP
jgi:Ca-activated chloride channel family protein